MIEINLLPKELRKKKKKMIEIPHISFLPVLSAVMGLIIVVHLFFSISISIKARALKRLERRWQEILPDKEEADRVISELTAMRSKIGAIDKLIQARMSWAKKLNDLSDSLIPGVWLNRLWIEKKVIYTKKKPQQGAGAAGMAKAIPKKDIAETLHLNGSVIAAGGEETAVVGNFMRSLKNNSGFFEDFDEVESAYMQRSKLKDIEVMDFELICYFGRKTGR